MFVCKICNKVFEYKKQLASHAGWHLRPVNWDFKPEIKKSFSEKNRNKAKEIWTYEKRKEHSALMKAIMPNVVKKNINSYSAQNVCGRTKLYTTYDSYGNETKVNGKW